MSSRLDPWAASRESRTAARLKGNEVARSPLTVFVIDDDESVRKAVRRLVQSAGLTARTFASAEDFLDAAPPSPDCLILDVRMPGGLGGLELQRRLASHGPRIPIVFITAHEDGQTRDSALAAGAVAFLMKPFDDQEVLDAVARATGPGGQAAPD